MNPDQPNPRLNPGPSAPPTTRAFRSPANEGRQSFLARIYRNALLVSASGLVLYNLTDIGHSRAPQLIINAMLIVILSACAVWVSRRPRDLHRIGELSTLAYSVAIGASAYFRMEGANAQDQLASLAQFGIGVATLALVAAIVCRRLVVGVQAMIGVGGLAGLSLFCMEEAARLPGGALRDLVLNHSAAVLTVSMLGMLARLLMNQQEKHALRIDKLDGQARTDGMTGLANRRGVSECFDRIVANPQAQQQAQHHAQQHAPGHPEMQQRNWLTLMDLDLLKRVNDTHGHAVGDEVLRLTGQAMRRSMREGECVARWGGEEFVILSTDCSLEDARDRIAHLRALMQATPWPHGIRQTASYGLTSMLPGETIETALGRADVALYRAKAAGRDCIELETAPGATRDRASRSDERATENAAPA